MSPDETAQTAIAARGRVALVTGAAAGIGAACARGLAADGFRGALADIDRAGLDLLAGDIGAPACAVGMDISDESAVRAGFDAAEVWGGPVSVLVCCAGIMSGDRTEPTPLDRMALADWQGTFAVNADGTFLCMREMLGRRRASPIENGRIITLSSAAAQLGGYRGDAAYVASKAAIIGLTKIAARQAAEFGITVNCVAPGPVETPMFDRMMPPEAVPGLTEHIPLGRIGAVADVASAVRFLAGAQAGWITGATLDVNGGYRMQ